jgi:MazG family protein
VAADSGLSRRGAILAGEKLPKLVDLMAHLRGPEGCPWDREQNYDTLKGLLLEEAYEVVDATTERDFRGLEDELGDLLFQVVFYSRLAEEEGRFDIDNVIERVHAKLIRRHPHVFGEVRARNAAEALKSWLNVKAQEQAATGQGKSAEKSLLDGIAPALPATLVAYELGLRAAEVGFDWKKAEDVLEKVEEEVRELRRELSQGASANSSRLEEEAGDLLFTAAHLARFLRSDPESCLRRANQKFARRFQALEKEVAAQGRNLRECTLEEMESLWNGLKSKEAG